MDNGLLTFDDDSPLFTKKKTKPKRKAKKKVPAKVDNVTAPVEVPKRKQKKKIVKVVNKHIPKYTIKSPSDCKHILPAIKKKLNAAWDRLNGDNIVAADVSNYIRGIANVAKKSRPKEYEELRILMQYAKTI